MITPSRQLELLFRDVPVQMAGAVGILNADGDDLVLLSARLVCITQNSLDWLGSQADRIMIFTNL